MILLLLLPLLPLLLFRGFCTSLWEAWQLTWDVLNAVIQAYRAVRRRGRRFPNWPVSFELLTAAMKVCTTRFGHRIVRSPHAQYIRVQSEVVGTLRGAVTCWRKGFSLQPVHVNGLEHLWLKRGGAVVLVYVHGGGYAALSPRFHVDFCASLAHEMTERSGVAVDAFLVNYRKVPEFVYPTAEQDVMAMYDYLLGEGYRPEQLLLAGDCTGAELVTAMMLRLRERGTSLPLGAILVCPVVDAAGLCEDTGVDAEHCILSKPLMQAIGNGYLPTAAARAAWRQNSSALDPSRDLSKLPPTFVLAGACDYLLRDVQCLVEKAKRDGATDWELDVQPNMPHVFTSFPGVILPQAKVGIHRMAAFAAKIIRDSVKAGEVDNSKVDTVEQDSVGA